MSKPATTESDAHGQPPTKKAAAILLLGDIADTSWRMFVPTIGFMLIGLYGDITFHTKPVLLLVGLLIGAVLAGLLVKRQLKKVKRP